MNTQNAIKLSIWLGQNSKSISYTALVVLALLKEKPRTLEELIKMFPGVDVADHIVSLYPRGGQNMRGTGLAVRKEHDTIMITDIGRAWLADIL